MKNPRWRIEYSTAETAIVGTWALPFAAYFAFLSNRVVATRMAKKQFIGDHVEGEATLKSTQDQLVIDSRCQGNFAEYIPLAFVFAATAELNGANRKFLSYAMGILFAARVAHAELGIRGQNALGMGRLIGHLTTQGFLAGVAGYSLYLVKGYWGF